MTRVIEEGSVCDAVKRVAVRVVEVQRHDGFQDLFGPRYIIEVGKQNTGFSEPVGKVVEEHVDVTRAYAARIADHYS